MKKSLFCFLLFLTAVVSAQTANVDSLVREIYKMKDDSLKTKALRTYAQALGDIDTVMSRQLFEKAIQVSRQIKNQREETKSITLYAAWFIDQSRYDSAEILLNIAQAIALKIDYKEYIPGIKLNMGNIYFAKSMYDTTIQLYLESAHGFEEFKKYNKAIIVYQNLCNIYTVLENYLKANYYIDNAIENATLGNDSIQLPRCFLTKAGLYTAIKEYTKSLDLLLKILPELKENSEISYVQIAYDNISKDYKELNLLKQAEVYADSSLQMARVIGRVDGLVASLLSKGDLAFVNNDFATAEIAYKEVYQHLQKDSNIIWLRDYNKSMYLLKAKQGNYQEALNYLYKYKAYSDSILNENNIKQIATVEAKFEKERNEKEILQLKHQQETNNNYIYGLLAVLLVLIISIFFIYRYLNQKKRIAEQQILQIQQEKQLEATKTILQIQEEERSRVAKDLHDGLGGMLSGIKLNLSAMKGNVILQQQDVGLFAKSIEQLDNAISEMRRVAHNMMPEALIKYGLSYAIQDYCSNINESKIVQVVFSEIGIKDRMESSSEIVLYRIIQELVNNAIKHAQAKNIMIQLLQNEDQLTLTVEDDGKGFDISTLQNIKGFGLTNIQSRVDYLKGALTIDSTKNIGTSVYITIPV